MNRNKKTQGLPINIIVMMIIGIIIFSMGIGLFSKFYSSGNKQITNLNLKIQTGISKLQCNQNVAICSPSHSIGLGKISDFNLYTSNLGNTGGIFKIKIDNSTSDLTKSCGVLEIAYPVEITFKISSGESAIFPFRVSSNQVSKGPCTFVTIVTLEKNDTTGFVSVGKTPITIRVG